jgi:hypothetical protein
MPTNEEIIFAVEAWQADPRVRPLMCGADSGHGPLEPVVEERRVILKCPDCSFRQTDIPDPVLRAHPFDDPRR